jgi:Co/Zn/Cd efflux system component
MLSDVAGFAVSLFAAWVVTRPSNAAFSYGCAHSPHQLK